MATVIATTGDSSNDDNGAAPDAKGGGVEVIDVDRNGKDCNADAGSLSTAVIVDGGGNWIEPMELIGLMRAVAKMPLLPQPSIAAAVDDGRHCRC